MDINMHATDFKNFQSRCLDIEQTIVVIRDKIYIRVCTCNKTYFYFFSPFFSLFSFFSPIHITTPHTDDAADTATTATITTNTTNTTNTTTTTTTTITTITTTTIWHTGSFRFGVLHRLELAS